MNTHSPIPSLVFRVEPAFTLDHKLAGPRLNGENILVGELRATSEVHTFCLGKVAEYQNSRTNAWLDFEGAHAVFVVGTRRSGKTYTLGVLAEGLVANGWIKQGPTTQAALIIDSMNVFATMPHLVEQTFSHDHMTRKELRRWKIDTEHLPVVLFYPRGTERPSEGKSMEISIRACDLSGEDWAALFGVDTFTDPMGHLIAEIYEKVTTDGYVLRSGGGHAPRSDYTIEDLLECLSDDPDVERFDQRTVEGVRRRFRAMQRLPVFDKAGIDLKELFKPGQISVLLVRDMDQDVRALLVSVIANRIMHLRSHADRYERLAEIYRHRLTLPIDESGISQTEAYTKLQEYRHEIAAGLSRGWMIIDEAHNFLPARGIVASSAPLKKFVNEGRNLGLSIVVATQNPSGLDPAIRRNADVLLVHSMSMRDDIVATEAMINTLVPDSFEVAGEKIGTRVFEQLVRSLPAGYAIVSNDAISRIFVTKIRPRLTVHGAVEY